MSSRIDTSAHCTICHIDFSVAHGGLYDCKRHDESESHKILAAEKEKSRPTQNIKAFLVKPEPVAGEEQLQCDVTRAEAMICNIIVDNNLSLSCDTGSFMFEDLANVMLGLLTIPHSSAHCERVFCCVRKNRTPQRSSMSDQTMESLLVLKSRPWAFWSL